MPALAVRFVPHLVETGIDIEQHLDAESVVDQFAHGMLDRLWIGPMAGEQEDRSDVPPLQAFRNVAHHPHVGVEAERQRAWNIAPYPGVSEGHCGKHQADAS